MSVDPDPWSSPLAAVLSQSFARSLRAAAVRDIVQRWMRENEVPEEDAPDELAAACVAVLASAATSARGYAILRDTLLPLIPAAILWTHLLWALSDSAAASRLNAGLLSPLTAPYSGIPPPERIPASVVRPAPPRHAASSSASAFNGPLPALSLLQPLLQQCTPLLDAPDLSPSPDLVSLLSLAIPHIDLQSAGGLTLDTVEQVMTLLPSMPSPLSQHLSAYLQAVLPLIDPRASTAPVLSGQAASNEMELDTAQNQQELSAVARGKLPSSLDILQADRVVSLWLAHLQYEHLHGFGHPDNDKPYEEPTDTEKGLVRIGSLLACGSQNFVEALVVGAIHNLEKWDASEERVAAWHMFTERLPRLLGWWSAHPPQAFTAPSLEAVLANVYTEERANHSRSLRDRLVNTYEELRQGAEIDEEGCTASLPDASSLAGPMTVFARRLIELDLISAEQAAKIIPETEFAASSGVVSLDEIASIPMSAIPTLAHLTAYSSGAARQFDRAAHQSLRQLSSLSPPDGLLLNIAASPTLLACLGTVTPRCQTIDSLTLALFDKPDVAGSRAEDPQGSLTRFGEAVVFVTAFAHAFGCPLPPVLQGWRHNISYAVLPATDQALIGGWLKALFGSDGIDDQILLATAHIDLCRLIPCFIQQAISAVMADQIDLDVLHSGLSYFSQPLLSWSLGLLVQWLCCEAVRNGALCALHLVVLQDLLLNEAFPTPLLRAVAKQVQGVLDPSAGLGPVLASSGLDVTAVQSKCTSAGIPFPAAPTQDMSTDPSMGLYLELQLLYTTTPPVDGWETRLVAAVSRAGREIGAEATVSIITHRAIDSQANADLCAAWTTVLLAMSDTSDVFLRDVLGRCSSISNHSSFVAPASTARAAHVLGSVAKLLLVLTGGTDEGQAIAEDIAFKLKGGRRQGAKRLASGNLLEDVKRCLATDEGLLSLYPALADL